MRKIASFKIENGNAANVYKNAEWDEYVVRFYNSRGVHLDASDYHTDSKDDAVSTAKHAIESERQYA
jgi:hypothetical protein